MRIVILFLVLVVSLFGKLGDGFVLLKDGANSSKIVQQKLFLWRATKGKAEIYLFGTMHLPHPVVYRVMPRVKGVIDRVDAVYTEIPLNFFTQMAAFQASVRDDNKSLKEILPATTYSKLNSAFRVINPLIDIKNFDKFKIWALSASLEALEYQLKYRDIKPIDKQIYSYAKSVGKEVGGIEKIEEQIDVFDRFNQKEQIIMLDASLDELKLHPNQSKELIKYYANRDGKGIMEIFTNSLKNVKISEDLKKRFLDAILYSRNIRMAKRIEDLVAKHPNKKYLFAFGTMHFLGQKSVLYYLEKDGFKIGN